MIFYLVVAGLFAWRLHRHSAWWAGGLAVVALVGGPALPDGLLAGRWTAGVLLVLVAASIAAPFLGVSRAVGPSVSRAAEAGLARVGGLRAVRGGGAVVARVGGVIGIGFVLLVALNGRPGPRGVVVASWQGLLLLAVMFAGTVVYRAEHRQLNRRPAALTLALVAGCLVLAHPGHALWAANVAAVAATFAVAHILRRRPVPRVLTFLGRVSYSLYLLHVVVLMAMTRLLPGSADRPVGVRIAFGLAVLALALAAAWLNHRLVEEPARRWGRRIVTRPWFDRSTGRFDTAQHAVARTSRGENAPASV
jgi:peptidoglycan/LPS O-acetylase OafA/YrhL